MRQRDYFHSKARKTNDCEDRPSYRCHRNSVSNAIKKGKGALLMRVGTITKLLENDKKRFYLAKERLHLRTFLSTEL